MHERTRWATLRGRLWNNEYTFGLIRTNRKSFLSRINCADLTPPSLASGVQYWRYEGNIYIWANRFLRVLLIHRRFIFQYSKIPVHEIFLIHGFQSRINMHGNMSRGRTTRRVAKIDFGIFSANQNPFVWSSIDLIGLSSWVDTSKNTSCSTRDIYRPNQSTRNATWLRSFHSKPFEPGKWWDSDLLYPQVIQFSRRLGRKVRPIFSRIFFLDVFR